MKNWIAALLLAAGAGGVAVIATPVSGATKIAGQTPDSAVVVVRYSVSRADSVSVLWVYAGTTTKRVYSVRRDRDTLRVAKGDVPQTVTVTLTPIRRGRQYDSKTLSTVIPARKLPPVVDSAAIDIAHRDSFPEYIFRPVGAVPDANNLYVLPMPSVFVGCVFAKNRYTGEYRIIVDSGETDAEAAKIEDACTPALNALLSEPGS